jgi:hypothetical protein
MHFLTQLAAAALLIVLATAVHGAGLLGTVRALRLERPGIRGRGLHPHTIALLGGVALLLFLLHGAEIALFGFFYFLIGAFGTVEEALFFSASAYSTLSQPAADFPLEWRLVGALEGLAGFLLIGWSTAFFVTDMNRLLRE